MWAYDVRRGGQLGETKDAEGPFFHLQEKIKIQRPLLPSFLSPSSRPAEAGLAYCTVITIISDSSRQRGEMRDCWVAGAQDRPHEPRRG